MWDQAKTSTKRPEHSRVWICALYISVQSINQSINQLYEQCCTSRYNYWHNLFLNYNYWIHVWSPFCDKIHIFRIHTMNIFISFMNTCIWKFIGIIGFVLLILHLGGAFFLFLNEQQQLCWQRHVEWWKWVCVVRRNPLIVVNYVYIILSLLGWWRSRELWWWWW
jgi:hypothetical protein